MLSSTGTTMESSKDGGKGAAPMGPPTTFSDASSNFRRIAAERYILDMSRARRILPTHPPEVTIPPAPSSLTPSPSTTTLGISSSMYDPGELAKRIAVRHLVQARDVDGNLTNGERRMPKQHKVAEARPHHLPMPQSTTPATRGPAPYLLHLTPTPSSLHPHCLTKDRLRKWVPAPNPSQTTDQSRPLEVERERIKVLRYCRNVRPTWVKFNSKDTKESEWCSRF